LTCISVALAGTGSAINPSRGQVSLVLDLGGTLLVVDVGCQAPNVAERLGYRLDEVEFYIVTHTHYDHVCGLPMVAFIKTFRSLEPGLTVYTTTSGAPYVEELLSLAVAGKRVRYKVHGVASGVQVRVGDALLKFIEADHTIEALGVVVEYRGIKVVVSGDTRPTEWYRKEATGAHLAVHEASLPSTMVEEARRTGHTTVEQAVEQVSGAELSILYHLTHWSEVEALETARKTNKILVVPDGTIVKIC